MREMRETKELLWVFLLMRQKSEKIYSEACIGNEPSHIGEGKTNSTLCHVTPFEIGVDTVDIDPANRSGNRANAQVFLDGMDIADLTL